MIEELEPLGPIGAEIRRRAESAGVLAIWRAQSRTVQRIVVRRGKPESTSISSISGHGIQVATPEGRSALASRDDLDGDEALALFDRVVDLAGQTTGLGVGAVRLPELTPLIEREVPTATSSGRPQRPTGVRFSSQGSNSGSSASDAVMSV